ncbi:MAG: hypothetical protein ACFE0J_13465 [Elainellaceae cyanobacterium]
MGELAKSAPPREIATHLMSRYSFDLGGYTVEHIVDHWLKYYPSEWLQPAVVEALYQGRYKAISVEQILTLWYRRGRPLHHFNGEFERMVCGQASETAVSRDDRMSNAESMKSQDDSSDTKSAVTPLGDRELGDREFDQGDADANVNPANLNLRDESSDDLPDSLLPFEFRSPKYHEGDRPKPEAVELSSAESPIEPFKPADELDTDAAELLTWSKGRLAQSPQSPQSPIHQFVPTTESNRLYSKLRAVLDRHDAEAQTSHLAIMSELGSRKKRDAD